MRKLILLFIAVILIAGNLKAGLDPTKQISQYSLSFFSKEQGLPIRGALCALKSKEDYLWFGTYLGLVRFDGYNFDLFSAKNNSAFTNSTVWCLYEDKDTVLWIGTFGGLLSHKNERWTYFDENDGLPSQGIEVLFESSDRKLWIGTTKGICYVEKGVVHHADLPDKLRSIIAVGFDEDADGNLWIASKDNGIFCMKNQSVDPVPIRGLDSNVELRTIFIDHNENVWTGAVDGLYFLSPDGVQKKYTEEDKLASNEVKYIFEDSGGILWFGCNKGLTRLSRGEFSSMKETHYFNQHDVKGICEDREGNLWVAAYNFGIYSMGNGKFIPYADEEGLKEKIIYSITESNSGNKIIGTRNLIYEFNGNKFFHHPANQFLPSPVVRDLLEDPFNGLWICTTDGLVCYNQGKTKIYNQATGLTNSTTRVILRDKMGNIWVGTENGLNMVNDKEIKQFTRADNLPNEFILSLFEDSYGNIWIGTRDGLAMYNGKVIKTYGFDKGLNSPVIFKMFETSDGYLLFGNNAGFSIYYPSKGMKSAGVENGLPVANSFQFLEDFSGTIWVTSSEGIYTFKSDEIGRFFNNEITTFNTTLYNASDGMKESQCVANSRSLLDHNGKLWFATYEGIATIDPINILTNNTVPLNIIQSVYVDSIEFINKHSIVLDPGSKRIKIRYTGISFTSTEKMKFRYILDNFDSHWIEAGNEREAVYTSLPAGKYTFKVVSCNNDGLWNEEPAILRIEKKPYFYQTVFFYVLIILGVIGLTVLFLYVRIRAVQQKNKYLEEQVLLRTKKIEQQKNEILSQKESLEEVNKELEKLSIVASETDNAVIVANASGTIEWVNEAFTRIYGYSLDEFKEKSGDSIMHSSANKKIQDDIAQCIESKKSVIYETEQETKDGRKLWIQTALTISTSEDGQIRKIIAVDSDITAMKKAETEIRNQNREILEQNEEIKHQREELLTQSENLARANTNLTKKNRQITDSIHYAKRIQDAILPENDLISSVFPEHFIYFKPRDIVSGDFYYFKQRGEKIIVALADCTGHGVPGAFMSIIGHNLIEQATSQENIGNAASVIENVSEIFNEKFLKNASEDDLDDGMDLALCIIDREKGIVDFSGAYQPMIYIQNNQLKEFQGNHCPIGKTIVSSVEKFENYSFNYSPGDVIYMFSDGYQDQFGGKNDRKFYYMNLKNLLFEIHNLEMADQFSRIDKTMETWMYGHRQIDDICVMGIRL